MKAPAVSNPLLPEVDRDWQEITILETRTSTHPFATNWRPAVNAYRCQAHFVIFADLAGIPPEAITVSVESRRLIIRGSRPAPEPGCQRSELTQLLALEIDHGMFERVLDLPQEIKADELTTEYRDGLLRIQLALKS
jgi:HSP20 family protein